MKIRIALLAAVMALAWTGAARAQANLCQLGASDGHATISPALHGDSVADARFFFTATCPDSTNVCSNGSLTGASCFGNLTAGHYILCTGACSGDTSTNPVSCDSGSGSTEVSSGDFNGACAGPLCAGGGSNVAYALIFDQATIESAMAHCGGDPLGDGAGLSEADFGGPILYLY